MRSTALDDRNKRTAAEKEKQDLQNKYDEAQRWRQQANDSAFLSAHGAQLVLKREEIAAKTTAIAEQRVKDATNRADARVKEADDLK